MRPRASPFRRTPIRPSWDSSNEFLNCDTHTSPLSAHEMDASVALCHYTHRSRSDQRHSMASDRITNYTTPATFEPTV